MHRELEPTQRERGKKKEGTASSQHKHTHTHPETCYTIFKKKNCISLNGKWLGCVFVSHIFRLNSHKVENF